MKFLQSTKIKPNFLRTTSEKTPQLTDEEDVEPAAGGSRLPRADGCGERDEEEEHADGGEQQPALLAKVADAGDLPAVRAARQRVVQRVEEEVVPAVRAVDAAHAGHVGHGGRGHGLARRQADHALAVGAGARNALEWRKKRTVKMISQGFSLASVSVQDKKRAKVVSVFVFVRNEQK